jgi:hypothetical protein
VSTSDKQPADQAPDREGSNERILYEDKVEQFELEEIELEESERLQWEDRVRRRRRAPKVQLSSKPGESGVVGFPSSVEYIRLMSAFGTTDFDHAQLMLSGVIQAASKGSPPSEKHINEALAAVTGIGANDEIEAMLATQMVATHMAVITALGRLKGSSIFQQDSNVNLAVKLLRTFMMQVEALERYRGKGRQQVTVEHLHVDAGMRAMKPGLDRAPRRGFHRPSLCIRPPPPRSRTQHRNRCFDVSTP